MSEPRVHPTAQVSPDALLGEGVEVGPYCCVGVGVRLGARTRLHSHVVIEGPTELGPSNEVHPFAVLGGSPQDRSYQGEATRLEIGEGNVFREHVTVHRGTRKDRGVTRIGSGGLFMAGSHIAHDVQVGDGVTLANGTLLAGHVRVEDHAVTGGLVAVQPFVRLGESCFLAGGAMVEQDVPPFTIASGDRARVRALNKVGLRRRGIPEASLRALEDAFRRIFRSGLARAEVIEQLQGDAPGDPWVQRLLLFLVGSRLLPGCKQRATMSFVRCGQKRVWRVALGLLPFPGGCTAKGLPCLAFPCSPRRFRVPRLLSARSLLSLGPRPLREPSVLLVPGSARMPCLKTRTRPTRSPTRRTTKSPIKKTTKRTTKQTIKKNPRSPRLAPERAPRSPQGQRSSCRPLPLLRRHLPLR